MRENTKSVLYPYAIKTLTNCTELITVTNRLGHGISYTLLEEMGTENAYKVIGKQQSGIIVPEQCQKEVLTVCAADNIDRQEETLSGFGITSCEQHNNSTW